MAIRDTTDYRIIAKVIYNKQADKFLSFEIPYPISVCYKVTNRCNYACPHCISSSSTDSSEGLPTEKAKELLNILYQAGVLRVMITGGEPFVRKDIIEILTYSVKLGLETLVTTNCAVMTGEHISSLANLGMFVQVSLDGPRKLNDQLRQRGSYEQTVEAIHELHAAGVDVRLNCTIQKANADVCNDIIRVALENNIKHVYFIIVCAQGRASDRRDEICLSPHEEVLLRSRISSIRKESDISIKILDYRLYGRACVLVESNGDLISQGWAEEDCVNTGNLFTSKMEKLWCDSGAFDHALHLLKNIRHPLIYQ